MAPLPLVAMFAWLNGRRRQGVKGKVNQKEDGVRLTSKMRPWVLRIETHPCFQVRLCWLY
jgi:hypothetical protein